MLEMGSKSTVGTVYNKSSNSPGHACLLALIPALYYNPFHLSDVLPNRRLT